MKDPLFNNVYKLFIIKIAKWFMLTMPILMLYYKDSGLTNEQSFQLKAFYSITIVLFEIPSGYLADLWGRKKTLILGAVLGTIGFAIYSFNTGYIYFLMAEITLGIGQSFISGSDSAMLYDTLKFSGKSKEYTRFEGLNTAIGNIAEASSALLGGFLAQISIILPFQIQTGVAFLAIPAAITLIEPKVVLAHTKKQTSSIIKILVSTLKTNRPLLFQVLFSSFVGCATLTMAWLYQLYLKEDLGVSFATIGIIAAVLNIVIGIISVYAYKIESRLGIKKSILLLTVLIPLTFILTGIVNSYYSIAVVLIFYTLRGYATPVLKDYINRYTNSNIRATVLSIRSFTIRLIFALVGPFAGKLADIRNFSFSYIVVGSIFATLLVSTYVLMIFTGGSSMATKPHSLHK